MNYITLVKKRSWTENERDKRSIKETKISEKYFSFIRKAKVLFKLITKRWNTIFISVHQISQTKRSVIPYLEAHNMFQFVVTNLNGYWLSFWKFSLCFFYFSFNWHQNSPNHTCQTLPGPQKYVTRKNIFYHSPIGVNYVDLPDFM